MVGPASLLAVWILSATAPDWATSADQPDRAATRAEYQCKAASGEEPTLAPTRAPDPPPAPLPRDPVYQVRRPARLDKDGLPDLPSAPPPPPRSTSAPSKEGIPGLAPLPPSKSAPEKEGIPGLPPVASPGKKGVLLLPPPPEEISTPSPLPPNEKDLSRLPPPEEIPTPAPHDELILPLRPREQHEGAGEVITREDADSIPCGEVYGRPADRGRWLDGICTESWLDQGATINTLSPRNRSNGPVTFNDRSNDYQLNQMYLRMGRDVDREGDAWDFGGRVDLLYGIDSIYAESRGLELNDDLSPKWNAQRYGLAMPQLYAEVFCPWGDGLSMKLGHFYSLFGYEAVTAPDNFFYSHSYTFQYGEPQTFTGLLGTTKLGELTVQAGMNRGFNNWENENNAFGFNGGIGWTSCNQRTSVAANIDVSREQPDPSTNLRTVMSLVFEQKLGDCWQYVIQYDYGNEPGAGVVVADPIGVANPTATWYGLDQYLYYTINERWKAGTRFEWFHDGNGSRVPGAGQSADYYELTAGVNWTPNQQVLLRPELRYDWTGTPGYLPFGDGTRSSQILLDCDLVVRF